MSIKTPVLILLAGALSVCQQVGQTELVSASFKNEQWYFVSE